MMEKTFSTSDRYLIAWLRHQEFDYLDTRVEQNGNKIEVEFVYDETEELISAIRDYRNKKTYMLSPYVFAKEIDSVMDIIFQEIKRYKN